MAEEGRLKNGIYKRGNSWCYSVKIDGERHRKSFGPDRAAAEFALAALRKEINRGRAFGDWGGLETLVTPKSKQTFGQAAKDYLDERAHLKKSTVDTYIDIQKTHLLPRFEDVQLGKITEQELAKFQSDLQRQGLSPPRVNSIMSHFGSILKVAVRRKVIAEDPAAGVDRVRERKAVIDPLSLEELNIALAHIEPHFRPLFVCLAWTGARPNELLALRWGDIDWKREEISITKGRVRGEEGLPKTRSSERDIPMLPPVSEALKTLQSRTVANADGYVFTDKKGTPIDKHLDRVWNRALKRAGLKHRPSYQLRHTFASLCLQQGAQPGWVSRVLGHGTMAMTFDYYVSYIPNKTKDNERIVSGLFESINQSEPTIVASSATGPQ